MTNPLLANVRLPGRIFPLPSKGLFYKEGILSEKAQKTGEIEVKPMSGLAEIALKSADLLYTGRALQEICNDCIPDIKKADLLNTKDIDAIFIFLRMATYGNEYSIDYKHDCKNAQDHTYMINLEHIVANQYNDSLTKETIDLLFSVKLDNNQLVRLKPMTFEDSMKIIHMRQAISSNFKEKTNDEYIKIIQDITIEDALAIIDNVDGIDDRVNIREWLCAITKPQLNAILNQYVIAMDWGIKLKHNIKCKDCKSDFSYDMQLDPVSFFLG
jgi:hypothetical protein